MNYLLGLIISMFLGFLTTNAIRSQGKIDPLGIVISSIGIGLALSAHIVFYTLFICGQYSAPAVWTGHLISAIVLLIINYRIYKPNLSAALPSWPADRKSWLGTLVLCLLLIPLWREAHFFPFGGWDAWASWNLKAKFIFLGGEQWKNMMDPSMWRSNNQYPFLLPLMNVWGWCVAQHPSVSTAIFNAVLFSFLTACTMFWGLNRCRRGILGLLAPLILFSIPFVNTLSISQYSDIVLAFYLLGCVAAIVIARREHNPALVITSGIFCGIMSFVKTEGLLACLICTAMIAASLFLEKRESRALIPSFLTAVALSALPGILFTLFWATENMSFVNGLTSADQPATWERLKAILIFFGIEVINFKWNGLWFLLACGFFIGWRKCINKELILIPIFLIIYLAGVTSYYWINTHYEIIWWMTTTLNRILYTLLPLVTFWLFAAILEEDKRTK